MSKRIVLMNGGRIEQLGTPVEIYKHPASRFVAEFIGECNFFDGTALDGGREARVDFGGRRVSDRHPVGANTVVQSGDVVSLAVRPEDCVLVAPGSGVLGTGVVTDQIFLGNRGIVEVRLDDGSSVRVSGDSGAGDVLGASVGIGIGVGAAGTVVERQASTPSKQEER